MEALSELFKEPTREEGEREEGVRGMNVEKVAENVAG